MELSLGRWGWQPPALFIFPHHLDSVDKPWVWAPWLACCLSKHGPLTSSSHSLTEQLEHKGTGPRNVLNHKAAVCNTFQSQRVWGVPLFMFPSTLLGQIEAGSGHPGWPVASANLGPRLTSPSIPPKGGSDAVHPGTPLDSTHYNSSHLAKDTQRGKASQNTPGPHRSSSNSSLGHELHGALQDSSTHTHFSSSCLTKVLPI